MVWPARLGAKAIVSPLPGSGDLLRQRTRPAVVVVHDGQGAQQRAALQLGRHGQEDSPARRATRASTGPAGRRGSDRKPCHRCTPRARGSMKGQTRKRRGRFDIPASERNGMASHTSPWPRYTPGPALSARPDVPPGWDEVRLQGVGLTSQLRVDWYGMWIGAMSKSNVPSLNGGQNASREPLGCASLRPGRPRRRFPNDSRHRIPC